MLLRQLRFRLSLAPDDSQIAAVISDVEAKLSEFKTTGTISGPILGAPPAYWADLLGRDPIADAKGIGTDMLFVRGSKDIQVWPEDFQSWQTALSGRPNAAFVTLPGLNHLFAEVEGQSTGAEYYRDAYASQRLIDLISARLAR
jgi:fermentation-respiration switch protein FrsA (DUF1100 family)